MRHTRWTPVVCKDCNAKLYFNSKAWHKIASPLLILLTLNLILKFIVGIENSLIYNIIFIILTILALVKLFVDLKSIKLDFEVK
jgi:hypothetical protein